MRKRRQKGTGTIFLRGSDQVWIGRRELPHDRGENRRVRTVSSKLFCKMIRQYSDLSKSLPQPQEPRPRRENIAAARAIGKHTESQWYAKVRDQNRLCYYCGKPGYAREPVRIGDRWVRLPLLVKDHMIPIARGGSDSIDNIVAACDPCNCSKGTMTADEYVAYLNRTTERSLI